MKFDISRLRYGTEYSDLIEKLNRGDRFVVVFSEQLVTSDKAFQTKVYMDDLFTAEIVLAGGDSLPLLYLMDLLGSEIPMTVDGVDLVDFASWMATRFCRQYAGLLEPDLFGSLPEKGIEQLLVSSDAPDLWFYKGEGYGSLLFFDPFEGGYCVTRTWIGAFENVPACLEEAIDRLVDRRLKKMLADYRAASIENRPQMMIMLVEKIRGEI